MEHILDTGADIIFITETWLKSIKSKFTAEIKEYGYKFLHNIREHAAKDRGGGVGIMLKVHIKARAVPKRDYSSFEYIVVKLPLSSTSFKAKYLFLICLYRLQEISLSRNFYG